LLLHYGLIGIIRNHSSKIRPLPRVEPEEEGNDDKSNGLSIIPPMALSDLDSSLASGDLEGVRSNSS
jgi:hypothetical protein